MSQHGQSKIILIPIVRRRVRVVSLTSDNCMGIAITILFFIGPPVTAKVLEIDRVAGYASDGYLGVSGELYTILVGVVGYIRSPTLSSWKEFLLG